MVLAPLLMGKAVSAVIDGAREALRDRLADAETDSETAPDTDGARATGD